MKRYTSAEKHAFARKMREHPTPTEAKLWDRLRNEALGQRIRCQVVMHGWIVDFYAPACGLVIEVDGSIHTLYRSAADRVRDGSLRAAGLRVLHIRAFDVEHDMQGVLASIRKALRARARKR